VKFRACGINEPQESPDSDSTAASPRCFLYSSDCKIHSDEHRFLVERCKSCRCRFSIDGLNVLERDVEKRMLDPCQSALTSKREMQILAEDAFAIDLRSILQIMSIYGERGATSFRRSFRVSTDPTYLMALPLMEKREAIVLSDKYPTDICPHAISRAMGTTIAMGQANASSVQFFSNRDRPSKSARRSNVTVATRVSYAYANMQEFQFQTATGRYGRRRCENSWNYAWLTPVSWDLMFQRQAARKEQSTVYPGEPKFVILQPSERKTEDFP
jgi:hypothetical protein